MSFPYKRNPGVADNEVLKRQYLRSTRSKLAALAIALDLEPGTYKVVKLVGGSEESGTISLLHPDFKIDVSQREFASGRKDIRIQSRAGLLHFLPARDLVSIPELAKKVRGLLPGIMPRPAPAPGLFKGDTPEEKLLSAIMGEPPHVDDTDRSH